MKDVFLSCLRLFFEKTGISDRFNGFEQYELIILAVVFTIALVVGFYFFRFYHSVLFFGAYIYICVLLLSRIMNWQNTVAIFSVSGVFLAFLFYKSIHFGSLFLCGFLGGLMGYMIFPNIFFVAFFVVLAMVVTFYFPVHGICAYMAFFGALGLSSLFNLPVYVGIIAGALFSVFQIFITRKQSVFDKRYADKIQYMLDKKKVAA